MALTCSVAQLCLILCNPIDCSMPGFPALYYLPELTNLGLLPQDQMIFGFLLGWGVGVPLLEPSTSSFLHH